MLKKLAIFTLFVSTLCIVIFGFGDSSYANTNNVNHEVIMEICEDCGVHGGVEYLDNTTLFKVFRHLYLVKNTDNSIIWSKESDFYTLPVVGTDGTIYVSGVDEKGKGKLFAFDKNGKQKWTFKNDLGAPTEVIIGKDGTVYFSEYNYSGYAGPYAEANVYAVSKDGKLKWKKKIDGDGQVSFLDNGTILVTTPSSFYNYKLDGSLVWSKVIDKEIYSFQFELVGQHIFVRHTKYDYEGENPPVHSIYLYNAADGKVVWNKKIKEEEFISPTVFTKGKDGFIASITENGVEAINLKGDVVWSYNLGYSIDAYSAKLFTSSDSLYINIFPEGSSKLVKLSLDGKEVYKKDLNANDRVDLISEKSGLIILSTYDDDKTKITSLDLSGSQVGSFNYGDFVFPVEIAGNIYYAADNKVYKISKHNSNKPSTVNGIVLYLDKTSVHVNGKEKSLSVAPFTKNGNTLVPLRFISEEFGANVKWDNASQTVTVELNGNKIVLKIGSKSVTVNGKNKKIQAAPEVTKSTTFVPLRFISEELGKEVLWNAQVKSITIK